MTKRWLIGIPPTGAARAYGIHIYQELKEIIGASSISVFDFGQWEKLLEQNLSPKGLDFQTDFVGQALISQAVDFEASHALILALCPLSAYYLRLLRKLHIKTAHWFYEDWRQTHYWQEIAHEYDFFFCVQEGSLGDQVTALGGNYQFLPTGTPKVCSELNLNIPWDQKSYDLAFVGIPSPYRIAILDQFATHTSKIIIGGPDWEHTPLAKYKCNKSSNWLPEKNTWEIYHNSRFTLNLSYQDPSCNNNHIEQQLSPRCYEMFFCNTIPIFENIEQITKQFSNSLNLKYLTYLSTPNFIQNTLQTTETQASEILKHNSNTQMRNTLKLKERLHSILQKMY